MPLILIWYYTIKKELRLKNVDTVPHIPVLLNEVLEGFSKIKDGTLIDCTLGYAGHSSAILQHFSNIRLIGIDRDDEALKFSANRLKKYLDRVTLLKGSFSSQLEEIDFNNITALLADFGVSSLQLDKRERGFNFDSELLDMRMDQRESFSAYELVNSYSQEMLEDIFKRYGEVREYRKVASAIVKKRELSPINSNQELSELIKTIVRKTGKTHPATLYFQAIRIEVNRELEEISALLDTLEKKNPKGAIVALITFHSLEDRLVKQRFRKWSKSCICPQDAMRCSCGNNHNLGKELNRKPIVATSSEIKENPRSRSAKLRLFQFKA